MIQTNPNSNPKTHKEIQQWLVEQVAEQVQINSDQIDIKAPFDSYGLNSSQALSIAAKAERKFGCKLSLVLLWHYPNIESLSHRLLEEIITTEKVFEI